MKLHTQRRAYEKSEGLGSDLFIDICIVSTRGVYLVHLVDLVHYQARNTGKA